MRRYRIEHHPDGWVVTGEPIAEWTRGYRRNTNAPWPRITVCHDRIDAERYVALVQARQLVLLGMNPHTGALEAA